MSFMDTIWGFVGPVVSLLPVFTITAIGIENGIAAIVALFVYYYLSTKFSAIFSVINAILWPIGLIFCIVNRLWLYAVIYIIAFLYLLWNGFRGQSNHSK